MGIEMEESLIIETIVRKTEENHIDKSVIEEAAAILQAGGLVAFPTETVYGLGADALHEEASRKIYEAKGRPSDNPLIVHIADEEQLTPIVKTVSDKAKALMKAFWPGPLTIIFQKSDVVPKGTTGGLDTVAVRMPEHKIALELIRISGVPIAAPSANTSGRPSPTNAEHVYEDLNGKIAMIIDGGNVGIGIESTIVDTTCEPPMILRPGYITKEKLEQVIGPVTMDKAVLEPASPDVIPKAPGMKYKHYAPKADFTMFSGEPDKVADYINRLTAEKISQGYKVGVIACDESVNKYKAGDVVSVGTRNNDITISRNLYRVLRDFDNKKVDYIFGETFTDEEFGQAIMNRMLKAAGYQIEIVT